MGELEDIFADLIADGENGAPLTPEKEKVSCDGCGEKIPADKLNKVSGDKLAGEAMLLCSECDFTEKNTVEDTPKALYEHDCDLCYLLGQNDAESNLTDLPAGDVYVCPQGGFPTVIIRHSDEPSDYRSSDEYLPRFALINY